MAITSKGKYLYSISASQFATTNDNIVAKREGVNKIELKESEILLLLNYTKGAETSVIITIQCEMLDYDTEKFDLCETDSSKNIIKYTRNLTTTGNYVYPINLPKRANKLFINLSSDVALSNIILELDLEYDL